MIRSLVIVIGLFVPNFAFAVDDLVGQSDEFSDSATTAQWTRRHVVEQGAVDQLERFEIDPVDRPGTMLLMPHTSTWFAGYRGAIAYKSLSGDFVFTTRVTASNRAGTGLPESTYSLAGLMLRTPPAGPSDPEDYVFLSVGYGDVNHPSQPGPGPHFEVKTTINGNSTLQLSPSNTLTASLQLARIGSTVVALYQRPGEAWQVREVYQRPDMPTTLQAGMFAYTDWNKVSTYSPAFHNSHVLHETLSPDPSSNPALPFRPDLVAAFDYTRFARPIVPPGINLATATPAQLLSFLGDHALPPPVVPGDINLYGHVDALDVSLFSPHVGHAAASWTTGDFNGDGLTTLMDLTILQAHLGPVVPSPAALSATAAVPEPGAWGLALCGLMLAWRWQAKA